LNASRQAGRSVSHLLFVVKIMINAGRRGSPWNSIAWWACLFAGWAVFSAASRADVFVIRAELSITSTDVYHYEHAFDDGFKDIEDDSQDNLTFLYVGEQKITITGNDWQTTESSSASGGGGGSSKHTWYTRCTSTCSFTIPAEWSSN
jgi:hypothetical protein